MLTECPYCKATFRVQHEQLDAAEGMVRCGDCDAIFNAPEHLVNEHPSASTAHAAQISQRYIDAMLVGSASSDEPAAEPEPLSEPLPESEHVETGESSPDSDSGDILANKSDGAESEPDAEAEAEADADADSNAEAESESAPDTTAESEDHIPINLDAIDAPAVEIETPPQQPSLKEQAPWLIGIAALLVLMIWQYAWSQRENPDWEPVVTAGCSILGCTLPLRSEIQLIRSDGLSVRVAEDNPNEMLLDLIITNYANFEQPLPALDLVFSDMDNLAMSVLKISPTEYLSANNLTISSLKPRLPLRLNLRFESPGDEVTNYRLYLRESAP